MRSTIFLFVFFSLLAPPFLTPVRPDSHSQESTGKKGPKTAVWLKLSPHNPNGEIIKTIKQYRVSLIFLRFTKKSLSQPDRIKRFISRIQTESPQTEIYPWVSMVVRSPAIFHSKNLIQDFIVFLEQNNLPGLHLDFEPPFGSLTFEYLEDYFLFLSAVKNRIIPGRKKLSIAVFPRMIRLFYEKNPRKRKHLRSLAQNINQFVLMMYDTGITEESTFLNHMVEHIHFMQRLVGDPKEQEIILGIASYGWHSNRSFRWMHDPRIENVKTTLTLLKNHQIRYPVKLAISGYAIFRYGTTDRTEWEQYARLVYQ